MVYTNVNSSFPSQVVPDAEKNTLDYGYQVGRAIENEWFRGDRGLGAGGRFGNNWQDFHRLRLYARGEQSVAKYKDELSINCLLYTSPSPRDATLSRMPSSA